MGSHSGAGTGRLARAGGRRWYCFLAAAVLLAGVALGETFLWFPSGAAIGVLVLSSLVALRLLRIAARREDEASPSGEPSGSDLPIPRPAEELRPSERHFLDVLHASSDAILLFDGSQFIDCNDAAAKMLGHPRREAFLAISPVELSPPTQPDGRSSAEKAAEMAAIAYRQGTHHFEWIHRKITGEDFPVDVTLTAVPFRGKTVILNVWRDITEQKQSQEALEESERRLARIIDFLPDATFAIDREGRVIAWNRAIEELTGVPASEMLGRGDHAYAVPLYGEAKPLLLDLALGGHPERWEDYEFVRREGARLVAEGYIPRLRGGQGGHAWGVAAPLYDRDGQVIGAIESFRDVTEQKRAADALRTGEAKYRAVYDGALDGIMLRTLDRRIIAANRAAVAMFGCKDEAELLATPLAELYPLRQPDGSLSSDKAARMIEIVTRDGAHLFEWQYLRRDGTPFYAMVGLTTLVLDDQPFLMTTARDITEQKRAEQAVRTSETKYRTLYDASSDAILLRTPERRIVGANKAAVALFGYADEEELKSVAPADLYTEYQPDGRLSSEKAPWMVEIALRDGSYSFEWQYRRKDGTAFLANVLWTRMALGGELILLTTIRDITEQRRAEEALQASERRYRLLAENTRDVIWTTDFAGVYTYLSPSAEQVFGVQWHEGMKLSAFDTLAPGSRDRAKEMIGEVVAAARQGHSLLRTAELELLRPDGSTVWVEATGGGMRDESGQIVGVMGVSRDITERKQAEEALRASERRYRLLADNLRDAIGTLDFSGRFTYISPSIEQLLGYTVDEITQAPMDKVLTGPSLARARRFLEKAVAAANLGQRIAGETIELEHIRKNGSHVVTETSFSGMYDESGRLVAIQGITRDITDRKLAEVNLALARDEAEAANRAKSQFLATMSHEIRTPMTAILGYADLLLDPTLNPSSRQNYALTIRRSGEHLLSLINDILDLSKIEAGKVALELGRCPLVPLLADVASLVRPRAEQRGISFSIEFPGPIPEAIRTDGARLRQAIINLAGNAVKFTEKGGVRIAASFAPDAFHGQPGIRIDVIDTGIGISQEVLPRLFRPFSQGDASVSRKYGGTGLGLAISRHLAQLLGGSLGVRSTPGQGSVFTLLVPTGNLDGVPMLQNPTEVTLDASSKAWTPDTPHLAGVEVLLAEDGLDNRELIEAVLRRAGAEVQTAENGRLALDMATDRPFDLILMDMNMPEMDGYQATAALRARGYPGPIVALTANAMIGDSERCREAGCDGYLTKPIDRGQLIQTIAALVRDRAAAAVAGSEAPPTDTAHEPPSPEATPMNPPEPLVSRLINEADMAPLVERFVARLGEQLDAMRRWQAGGEHEELRRQAHKLKGAGGSYGYPELTDACTTLEDAARAADPPAELAALDAVAALIHAIQNGCPAAFSTRTPP